MSVPSLRAICMHPWAWLLAGCMLVAAVYTPGISGSWLFDDYPNIVENPGVHISDWSVPSLARAALASPASDFKRPLASLSFAINYLTTGASAPAMKLTNLVIHLLNGLFAFLVLRLVFASARPANEASAGDGRWAAVAAIGWMLLPINLTSVLYVVQRMESMANLAVLAGLWAYLHGRRQRLNGKGGLALALLGVILATGVGALSKETAVMLPLYAGLTEACLFHWRRRVTEDTSRDWPVIGFFVAILVVPLVAGITWLAPGLLQPSTWATRNFTLGTRLLSEARIVVDYIGWTLFPTPRALSFYHDDFVISQSLLDPPSTLISIVAIVGLVASAWILRKRLPLFSLGVAWYLGCHTLTGTVLPLELIYEHRNYFSSLGLVLAVAALSQPLLTLSGASRRLTTFALAMIGLLWTGMTLVTAQAWGDPLSLAKDLAFRATESPRAQYELGRTYIIYGNYDKSSPFVALAYAPLERAAAIPGSSILPEQALIFMNSRMGLPVKDTWWTSMNEKLARSPASIQDESSLDSLAKCIGSGSCDFDPKRLFEAFSAALSHPNPSPRLLAMYASFAMDVLKDEDLAYRVQQEAVAGAPGEAAYRLTLARLAVRRGDLAVARAQAQAMTRMNVGGRFTDDLAPLEIAIARAASTGCPNTKGCR